MDRAHAHDKLLSYRAHTESAVTSVQKDLASQQRSEEPSSSFRPEEECGGTGNEDILNTPFLDVEGTTDRENLPPCKEVILHPEVLLAKILLRGV